MKKTIKTTLIALLLTLVLAAGYFSYNYLSGKYKPDDMQNKEFRTDQDPAVEDERENRTKAPDFAVTDEDGNEISLSSAIGKPIVLNFWASWCGPCQKEMPAFQRVYEDLSEEVLFMMINLTDGQRETEEKAKNFVRDQGHTFPILFDLSQQAAYTYGISSIPTTYFLDSDGYIVTGELGAIDEETLRRRIDMIHQAK